MVIRAGVQTGETRNSKLASKSRRVAKKREEGKHPNPPECYQKQGDLLESSEKMRTGIKVDRHL